MDFVSRPDNFPIFIDYCLFVIHSVYSLNNPRYPDSHKLYEVLCRILKYTIYLYQSSINIKNLQYFCLHLYLNYYLYIRDGSFNSNFSANCAYISSRTNCLSKCYLACVDGGWLLWTRYIIFRLYIVCRLYIYI